MTNENISPSNLSNKSITGSTSDQKSYWVYNFKNSVKISAVEIFSVEQSNLTKRLSQISIKLFSIKIAYSTNVTAVNTYLDDNIILIKSATFRKLDSIASSDDIHGVFVVDPQYVSIITPNANYIDQFITPPIQQLTYESVSSVYSISILSNTSNKNLSLSYIFIYDDTGNLIDLPYQDYSNPYQSSTEDSSYAKNAIKKLEPTKEYPNLQNRTLNHAISLFNKSTNSFLGIPENSFIGSNTSTTPDQKSYWIYNFNNPVNVSAVEIFTINDYPERTSNISIKLFSSNIPYTTDVLISNLYLNNPMNILRTATFRKLDSIASSDDIHGVFVIDKNYVSTGTNYIDQFIIQQKPTEPPKRTSSYTKPIQPTTTPYIPIQPTTTQVQQTTIELALEPTTAPAPTQTQTPTPTPTPKFNCNSLSCKQTDCNSTDDCYYIKKTSICKNKYEYSQEFNNNSKTFKCQMNPIDQNNKTSDYYLDCINTNVPISEYLFNNISLNPNCNIYDNNCNLLLNQSPNPINYNELKNYMIPFNSFNNEFDIKQKFTSSQLENISANNNLIYFNDIYNNNNYAINVVNNPFTSNNTVLSSNTQISNDITTISKETGQYLTINK